MPESQPSDVEIGPQALLAEYGQVCTTFRTLTDIRFKLLAFLPLAAGVTTAITGSSTAERFLISLFGFVATVGVATYNYRNDQLYDELVGRAAEIERRLGLPDGAFANRPGPWLKLSFGGIFRHKIDHRTAIGIIYAASFALWLFGMIAPTLEWLRGHSPPATRSDPFLADWVEPAALLLTLAVVATATVAIRSQRKWRKTEMARAAVQAVRIAESRELAELPDDDAFVRECATLSSATGESIKARVRFYSGLDPAARRFFVPEGSKREEASYLVALVTDLPPRWIRDWVTNRKGEL
jgi:hypothetical protein